MQKYFITVLAFGILLSGCGGMNVANTSSSSPSTNDTTAATYSISGTVGGATREGVTITLSGGASKTTTTNSIGTYALGGLSNESYIITPSLSGYTFSPTSRTATIESANITGEGFTATRESGGVIAASGTWEVIQSNGNPEFKSADFVNSTTGWIVGGNNESILKTTNGGASWTSQKQGSQQVMLNALDAYSADIVYVVGSGGIIYKTSDSGNSWGTLESKTSSNLYDVSFVSSSEGWIVGAGGKIFHTTNGSTWSPQTSEITSDLLGVKFFNSTTGYAVGVKSSQSNTGVIIKTTTGGSTWTEITVPTAGNSIFQSIYLLNADAGIIVGKNGKILKFSSGGADITIPTNNTPNKLSDVTFTSNEIGWAVGDNLTILKTIDGGSTWTTAYGSSEDAEELRGVAFIDSDTGFAVGTKATILKYSVK